MSLYVNGKLDSTTDATFTSASGPFVIGAGRSGGVRVGQLAGVVDHVQVWARTLSAAEAAAHSNLTVLRAHYSTDELTGTTTKDEVTGLQGTLSGDVGWASTLADPDDPNQTWSSNDKWLRFADSRTGVMTGPRPENLRTDRSYTVSAWVRHRAFGDAEAAVVTLGDSSFVLGYRPDTGRWGFQLPDGAVALSRMSAAPDEWVHLAATYDAATGTIALYVQGIKQNSVQTGLQTTNGTGDLHVGRGVSGDVDDVRIYSGTMTAQEVTKLYAASMHR
jgi:hypothetical protein